jgi:hypothetical protein
LRHAWPALALFDLPFRRTYECGIVEQDRMGGGHLALRAMRTGSRDLQLAADVLQRALEGRGLVSDAPALLRHIETGRS